MVKRRAQRVFNDALRFGGGELVFGLALKFRVAHKNGKDGAGRAEHVFGGDVGGFFIASEFCVAFEALGQRRAQARFMGAAFGCRNGVAIGMHEPVSITEPGGAP